MTSVVDFFCGIGGVSNCLSAETSLTGFDINRTALDIHALNFAHELRCRAIESIRPADLPAAGQDGCLWWMSPPCQPHTRRGKQRDLQDPRSAALLNLLDLIAVGKPRWLALENVPEFAGSKSLQRVIDSLDRLGYQFRFRTWCPTEFGWFNRRPRFFLMATLRGGLSDWAPPPEIAGSPWLEPAPVDAELTIDPGVHQRFARAAHQVQRDDWLAGRVTTACFTSAYGRSPVHSGSWLVEPGRVRRFSPREVLSQLGFPVDFRLPAVADSRLWPLTGNSLSRITATWVLRHLLPDSSGIGLRDDLPTPVEQTGER